MLQWTDSCVGRNIKLRHCKLPPRRRRQTAFFWDISQCVVVECVWNVMGHAQKPDFVFRRNGRVHLNQLGRQFSRLLAAEVCASAIVMLDTPRSEVVWRIVATHSIRQFPLHFPSRASPCAIRFQTHSNSFMGPISCPEMSVRNNHYTLRNSSKDRSSQNIWLFIDTECVVCNAVLIRHNFVKVLLSWDILKW